MTRFAPQWLAARVRSQLRAARAADALAAVTGNGHVPVTVSALAVRRPVLGWLRRTSVRDRAQWADRALAWPLVNWLEAAVWMGVAVTLGVSYYGSYDNLVDVLGALGYAAGPAHVVPVALDAPLTVSVIGQFLLARWKSRATRRWRLFAVTAITAPLSLAGNALHGALRFGTAGQAPQLDLSLLDLHRPEVVIRLVAAMVPAIGVILAVLVTELVLREHARLEELRERAGAGSDDESEAPAAARSRSQAAAMPVDPRALRVARTGGDWHQVAATTGLKENAAKRALTAARKQLAAEARGSHAASASRPHIPDGEAAVALVAAAAEEA